MPHFDGKFNVIQNMLFYKFLLNHFLAKKSVAFNKSLESIIFDDEKEILDKDWNEKLRHESVKEVQTIDIWNVLPEEISRSGVVILQECLDEITILRKMKGIEIDKVVLEHISLQEQYSAPKYDMSLILYQNAETLNIRKFKKEVSWIEKLLETTVSNLKSMRNFDNLLRIMNEQETNQETENSILLSRKFNQNEISRLRQCIDLEKEAALKRIQQLTEKLGNFKDELNVILFSLFF